MSDAVLIASIVCGTVVLNSLILFGAILLIVWQARKAVDQMTGVHIKKQVEVDVA